MMDKNILILGGALVALFALTRKSSTQSGYLGAEMPQATSGGSSPVNTGENFEQPPLLNLGNKQAIEEARQSVAVVDTGVKFQGADVLQDLGLAGHPLELQAGIVTLGPNVTRDIMGCQSYDKATHTGQIWDMSTRACHDIAWYKINQPGLVATWRISDPSL
ncbi:MAG: hypothetical protein WC359_13860 [Dehalococcoidia bacterium]|jgi:hypothetical protein